jgi:hypothetical protein
MRSFLILPLAFSFSLTTAQDPVLTLKLTDAYPVEMPALHAYPLYATATIEEPHTITSVTFMVDGVDIGEVFGNGTYHVWWTPGSYGAHTVEAVATASNGNSTTQSVTVEVSSTIADRTVTTMDDAVIDWGTMGSQWYEDEYALPQSVGAYHQIMAHLVVTCPSVPGGCDDWDRLASIQAQAPNGEWVEIIRYITPYGVACDHELDVTDFASILQGNTPMRMYIDTWGTGGWKMDLVLTYETGTPEFLYTTIHTAWHGNYNFGDPANLQPAGTVTIDPGVDAASASLRVVTSGHGWGQNNTSNAAEFFNATHDLVVNGTSFEQQLWTDCNPNPDNCSPQYGTWQYNRAGWCPGAIAQPYEYDITSLLNGSPLELSYIFQDDYQDVCHANNPACVSGQTCPDCNDGYNPFYRVGAYMISRSNSPSVVGVASIAQEVENGITIGPNPTSGNFTLALKRDMGPCVVTLHDVSGATLKNWLFASKDSLEAYRFDVREVAAGLIS